MMSKSLKQSLYYLLMGAMIVVSLTGCKKDEDDETTAKNYYYDPQVPWGNIDLNQVKVQNVKNLAADVSIIEKIKLAWEVPPLYTTLNFKIMIFKKKEAESSWELPSPADEASPADFYKVSEFSKEEGVWKLFKDGEEYTSYPSTDGQRFVDENGTDPATGEVLNNVDTDSNYSYWVYVQLNDTDWSTGVRLNSKSKNQSSSFEVPTAEEFWAKKKWTLGSKPTAPPGGGTVFQTLYTMNPGSATPGNPRGGIAFAYSGNIMYYADTEANRVLVYSRDGALDCEALEDPYEKQACLFQYASAPLQARNVLGQATVNDTKTCSEYATMCSPQTSQAACEQASAICTWQAPNGSVPGSCEAQTKCLNKPRKVTVINNKLFISDSGNNRIVVHDALPKDGCDAEVSPGIIRPRQCRPNWVIGKAGLQDNTNYSLPAVGDAILDSPTDVAVQGDKLFIADTGNNRVVRIDRYFDRDYYSCTPDTWGGPVCKFKAVLGQPDFFTKLTFDEMVTADPSILTGALGDQVAPAHARLLRRYFKAPTRLKFVDFQNDADPLNDSLLISSNELFERNNILGGRNALRGRIMIFGTNPIKDDIPTCNPATFETDDKCDATDVMGQERFDRIPVISGAGSNAYNQLQYGLYSIDDFDMINVLGNDTNLPPKRVLMGVNSHDNFVYIWTDITNRNTDGYPYSYKVVDPAGYYDPDTQQSRPDLQSLCGIRIIEETSNIYVSDCGDSHVQEIQAYKLPTQ